VFRCGVVLLGHRPLHGQQHARGYHMPVVDVPNPDAVNRGGGFCSLQSIQPCRARFNVNLRSTAALARDAHRDGTEILRVRVLG
jgi:hypothetical protein